LGRVEAHEGNLDGATRALQQAVAFANRANDLDRSAWPQTRLLTIISDASGPEAVSPLVAELRSTAIRSGNPRVLAALHVFLAQIEARRGLSGNARRHLTAADALLSKAPNAWLQSMIEQLRSTLFIITADYRVALKHAEKSVELASQSGQSLSQAVS